MRWYVAAFQADNGEICAVSAPSVSLEVAERDAEKWRSPEDTTETFIAYRELPGWKRLTPSKYGPCKHCGRTIHDGSPARGYVHRGDTGYTGKSRCDPEESGLRYGYNAEPIGQPCQTPCIGTKD